MGTGIGEFLRRRTQLFANGIPPDITRDVFDGVGRAEDVVVIAHLPKALNMGLAKLKGGPQFEDAHEFKEVGLGLSALREKMKVVWHEAVGVEEKRLAGGAFVQ